MRALWWMILAIAILVAGGPAMAQRYDPHYPVCRQVWKLGGVTWVDCRYTSWDQCVMDATPSQGMCLLNPYWPQAQQGSPGRHRRRGEVAPGRTIRATLVIGRVLAPVTYPTRAC